MSQHIYKAVNSVGQPLTILLGYDRPLDFVFCTVIAANDEVLYCNLDDPNAGTDQQDVNYYRPLLRELGVTVPDSVYREVMSDQRLRVGNRLVVHTEGE